MIDEVLNTSLWLVSPVWIMFNVKTFLIASYLTNVSHMIYFPTIKNLIKYLLVA